MEEEAFCKYCLYRLLDNVLAEIRFDAYEEKGEWVAKKTALLANFVIDLPTELHQLHKQKDPHQYAKLLAAYEAYSKRINLNQWFSERKMETYQIYLGRKDSGTIK